MYTALSSMKISDERPAPRYFVSEAVHTILLNVSGTSFQVTNQLPDDLERLIEAPEAEQKCTACLIAQLTSDCEEAMSVMSSANASTFIGCGK